MRLATVRTMKKYNRDFTDSMCLQNSASRNVRAYGPYLRIATFCSRGGQAIKAFRQNQAIDKRKGAEDPKRTVDEPPAKGDVTNRPAN